MERFRNVLHALKPALLMVVVQVVSAVVNIFYKLAADDGMSLTILIAYRLIFATIFIVPLALIVERKSRPKLTWVVLFHGFLCGLLGGALAQNLYVESLALTSATYVSAMSNLVPPATFILALCFGLEKLGLGSVAGKAKVIGTLIGVGGAMLLTFYKGAEIDIWSTHVDLLHHHQPHIGQVESHRALGSLMALGSCITYASWLTIQAKMSLRYPCPYSSTALMSLMASIQCTVFALCMEKDWNQWKLGWNIRLVTVAFSGIVASGLMVTLIAWCVRMRGPLYVSIFSPLMLVLVVIAGTLLLDEKLRVGSILGSALIICGLYVVLWGKNKEMNQLAPSRSSREAESIKIVVTSPTDNNTCDCSNSINSRNNSISPIDDLQDVEFEKEKI